MTIEIIRCVITLAVLLITGFIIPYLKANIEAEKLNKILDMVDIAVGAAEQIAAVYGHDGEWKKNFVTQYIRDLGLDVDADTLNLMIENAVIQLHNELRA